MIKRLSLATVFMMLCLFAAPLPTSAYDPFNGVDCETSGRTINPARANRDPSTSAVCTSKTTDNPIAGPDGLIARITVIVTTIAGAAAIVMIVIGGLRFITSGGDSGKVASAKNTVVNSLIGLAVIILARTIIMFVIGRL